jgi:hypothetical protein
MYLASDNRTSGGEGQDVDLPRNLTAVEVVMAVTWPCRACHLDAVSTGHIVHCVELAA